MDNKLILDQAIKGHSVIILGQSGTGKSTLSKQIAKEISVKGRNVACTATTGIASLNIGGRTIHSWCGIGDGRYSNGELMSKLSTDEHFSVYKNNILKTDVLLIDEISMLSKKQFEQIEYICRNVRESNYIFGEIQLIGVGDFFQLPPVPDNLKQDPGEYCFKSDLFNKIFSHKFILTHVMRQTQIDFIKAVNDVSKGDLPEDTLNLIKRLNRPLPPGDDPIRLCARNFDCFVFNSCKLMDMDGKVHVFKAVDDGDLTKLENIPAPKSLHLKIGCPVMLLKNLSSKLVNGLRGTVSYINNENETVGVNFISLNSENFSAELKKETFTLYSALDNKVVASRRQYPLCLAFSITIHKAQGLTLQRVEVDASCIFSPGQFGVAIGRATAKKGLRIIGFHPACVLKHDQSLYDYYNNVDSNVNFDDCLGCCKYNIDEVKQQGVAESHYTSPNHELSDFSEDELNEIDFLLSSDADLMAIGETGNETEKNIEAEVEKVIDVTEISVLFCGEKTAPRDQVISLHYQNLICNKLEKVEKFVNNLFASLTDIFKKNMW